MDKYGNVNPKSARHDFKNLFTIFFHLGCFSKEKGIYKGIDYTPLNRWNMANTLEYKADNQVKITQCSRVKCSFSYNFFQSYVGVINNDTIYYNLRLLAYSDYFLSSKKWEAFYGYIDIYNKNDAKDRKEYIMGLIPTEDDEIVELHLNR